MRMFLLFCGYRVGNKIQFDVLNNLDLRVRILFHFLEGKYPRKGI